MDKQGLINKINQLQAERRQAIVNNNQQELADIVFKLNRLYKQWATIERIERAYQKMQTVDAD